MGGFDVLDPTLDLYQNRFLEASAGTGKTFAIENIVTRLLQDGIDLERILIVTFTKAATLDLKTRIRKNIAKYGLTEALGKFDEARIFTIHSFCFHSLREYALEANLSLEQEENPSDLELRKIIKDHLRTLEGFSSKQLQKVLTKGIDHLINSVLRIAQDRIPIEVGRSYAECAKALRALPYDSEEIFALAPYFGKMCNRQKELKYTKEFEEFSAFIKGEDVDVVDSPILLMHPENKLKRAPEVHSDFLEKALPILQEMSDELSIFARICEGARRKIETSEHLFFEDLLLKMDEKVQEQAFAEKIRAQYDVVLIDEFQDTNPLQWRIFKTLFLEKLLYLVGDPKQAIYRFRHADIYTYMEAKKTIAIHDVLDTNYRSTPTLVQQLNDLFAQVPDLISLPRTGESIPCPAVKWDESKKDEGGLALFQAETEEQLFAHILCKVEKPYASNAVLVKDRYQAERFLQYAKRYGFPAVSRRARSLLESTAFTALQELLQAVLFPREREKALRVLGGPLYALSIEEMESSNPFFEYHALLLNRGLMPFFRKWRSDQGAALVARDEMLYQDVMQLVELLAEERIATEHLLPYLEQLQEEIPARQNSSVDAIQVLTIHVSKGLEFDTVFPIGLILPSPRRRELVCHDGRYVLDDEVQALHHKELDAEEMRQLYVAFTRAKKRLYIPALLEGRGPINRFLSQVNLTGEVVSSPPPRAIEEPPKKLIPPKPIQRTFTPLNIDSFSSIYKHEGKKLETTPTLPAGAEVGTALHTLLEKLPFHQFEKYFDQAIDGSILMPHYDEVFEMVKRALTTPFPKINCALCELDPKKILKEMEFLYPTESGYMKGYVDLFFEHDEKFYLLDWKSNVVETTVEEVMERHHYKEQANIYRIAIKRYLSLYANQNFNSSFYYFLRQENAIYVL